MPRLAFQPHDALLWIANGVLYFDINIGWDMVLDFSLGLGIHMYASCQMLYFPLCYPHHTSPRRLRAVCCV